MVFSAVLLLMIVPFLFSACAKVRSVELHYQETFPDDSKLVSGSDQEIKISEMKGRYKVVFYLDSTNPDCLQRLASIHKIMQVYQAPDLSYLVLWEDRIPEDAVRKSGIDLNRNYTFQNRFSVSKEKPAGFLLDENNRVLQVTGYSYIDLIKKILSIGKDPDAVRKINDSILQDAFGQGKTDRDPQKQTLFLFVSSGCKLCAQTERTLSETLPALQKKFNVVTIRPDFDAAKQYDVNRVTDYSLVYFDAYDQQYNVKQFPLFVVLDQDKQVLKRFTKIDDLLTDAGIDAPDASVSSE